MFLGAYRFAGDPADLVPAYDRLLAAMDTTSFDLHACAVSDDGIVVVDACPSEEVFRSFSTSDGWRAACTAAGLPAPTVEPLGEVHRTHIGEGVGR
jgi:hypothetical protein